VNNKRLRLAIIGEYNYSDPLHYATNLSLDHVGNQLDILIDYYWFSFWEFEQVSNTLTSWDGLWIRPSSKHNSKRIKNVISYCASIKTPTLVTELGFHFFIEQLLSTKTTSPYLQEISLQEQKVIPKSDSMLTLFNHHFRIELTQHRHIIPKNIQYSLEEHFIDTESYDEHGNIEIVSLKDHPFFVVAQHAPQATSTAENAHPLLCAFINICSDHYHNTI